MGMTKPLLSAMAVFFINMDFAVAQDDLKKVQAKGDAAFMEIDSSAFVPYNCLW